MCSLALDRQRIVFATLFRHLVYRLCELSRQNLHDTVCIGVVVDW